MGSFLAREHSRLDASDSHAWRTFFIAIGALAAALGLALFSSAATETAAAVAGRCFGAGRSPAWPAGVAFTIVPVLARRTPLRWRCRHVHRLRRFTREGVVVRRRHPGAGPGRGQHRQQSLVHDPGLAAGQHPHLPAWFLQAMLSGVEVRVELPVEHISAGQPVVALWSS